MPLSNSVPRGFGFVHHSIAILYHQVPNPNLTIRNFLIAVRREQRRTRRAAAAAAPNPHPHRHGRGAAARRVVGTVRDHAVERVAGQARGAARAPQPRRHARAQAVEVRRRTSACTRREDVNLRAPRYTRVSVRLGMVCVAEHTPMWTAGCWTCRGRTWRWCSTSVSSPTAGAAPGCVGSSHPTSDPAPAISPQRGVDVGSKLHSCRAQRWLGDVMTRYHLPRAHSLAEDAHGVPVVSSR